MDNQLQKRIETLARDFAEDMMTLMKESQEPMYFNIGILTRQDDNDDAGKHDYFHYAFREEDKNQPFIDDSKVKYYD